jgi:hypothetical protein
MNALQTLGFAISIASLTTLGGCLSEHDGPANAAIADLQQQTGTREYTLHCAAKGDSGPTDVVFAIESSKTHGVSLNMNTGTQAKAEVSAMSTSLDVNAGRSLVFQMSPKGQTCTIPEQGNAELGCPQLDTVRFLVPEAGTEGVATASATFSQTTNRRDGYGTWEFANCEVKVAPRDEQASGICKALAGKFGSGACSVAK